MTHGAYTAANGGNVCFVAGTLVLTENDEKPIEEIQPGDYVWSWDEKTGETQLQPVLETYINETNELVRVSVAGEEIVCTPNHPFYSPVKGWTDAVQLRAGDILVLLNGEYVVVEWVQHDLLENPIKIFNFQVANTHTYYVSIGIVVHNSCNYRENAKAYYGNDGIGQDAHHVFPQRFREQFYSFAGIDIDEPFRIRFIESSVHRSRSFAYNKLWVSFFDGRANASIETIEIAAQYFMKVIYG